MKLSYIKLRRIIFCKWLTLKYYLQGGTWEEADHIARAIVYGWNWSEKKGWVQDEK